MILIRVLVSGGGGGGPPVLAVEPAASGGELLGGHYLEGRPIGEGEDDAAVDGEAGVGVCGGVAGEDCGSSTTGGYYNG